MGQAAAGIQTFPGCTALALLLKGSQLYVANAGAHATGAVCHYISMLRCAAIQPSSKRSTSHACMHAQIVKLRTSRRLPLCAELQV